MSATHNQTGETDPKEGSSAAVAPTVPPSNADIKKKQHLLVFLFGVVLVTVGLGAILSASYDNNSVQRLGQNPASSPTPDNAFNSADGSSTVDDKNNGTVFPMTTPLLPSIGPISTPSLMPSLSMEAEQFGFYLMGDIVSELE